VNAFASEVSRVAREVGHGGKLGGQAQVPGWRAPGRTHDNVNLMARTSRQVRNIAEVTTAVAKGDLSKKITADVKGEILELKLTVNTCGPVERLCLGSVAGGARSGHGGQAGRAGAGAGGGGHWKDLTDNVNLMAANLTGQCAHIAE